jgi:hypothetical protein
VAVNQGAAVPAPLLWRLGLGVRRVAMITFALFLFVGALQVMKTGAAGLDFLQNGGWFVRNAGATFGLGWLGALVVLSGSPVAASALTLVAADSISEIEGFTMLTGSRLGAAFVVLMVGVVYAIRGGRGFRLKPLSTAVISLIVTAAMYIPGSVIGVGLLRWEPFREMRLSSPPVFVDVVDVVYSDALNALASLPGLVVFLGGLGLLLIAFKLIDGVIPAISETAIERSKSGWLRKKWPMFALGCLVALVTMSVSVALTVLVPLVAKDLVRREDILPYIMGANIATLGDTLLAGFVLGSPAAVRIVLADIIGVTLVSLFILAFLYDPFRRLILALQARIVSNRFRLLAFTVALFITPLTIITASSMFRA